MYILLQQKEHHIGTFGQIIFSPTLCNLELSCSFYDFLTWLLLFTLTWHCWTKRQRKMEIGKCLWKYHIISYWMWRTGELFQPNMHWADHITSTATATKKKPFSWFIEQFAPQAEQNKNKIVKTFRDCRVQNAVIAVTLGKTCQCIYGLMGAKAPKHLNYAHLGRKALVSDFYYL